MSRGLERVNVPGFLFVMNELEIKAKRQVIERHKYLENYIVSISEMVNLICSEYADGPSIKTVRGLFRLRDLLIDVEPNRKDFNDIHPPEIKTLNYITGFQGGYLGLKFKDVISDHDEIIQQKFAKKALKERLDFVFGSDGSGSVNGVEAEQSGNHCSEEDFKNNMQKTDQQQLPDFVVELFDGLFHTKKNLTDRGKMLGYAYGRIKDIINTAAGKSEHIKNKVEQVLKVEIKGKKQIFTYEEKGNFEIRIETKTKTKKSKIYIYYTIFSGVALLLASVESLSTEILLDQLNLVLGDNLDNSLTLDSGIVAEKKDEDT